MTFDLRSAILDLLTYIKKVLGPSPDIASQYDIYIMYLSYTVLKIKP